MTITDRDQALLTQLTEVQIDLAEARTRYKPTSSMVTSLEARISQLEPLLRREQLDAVDLALEQNSQRLVNTKNQRQTLNNQFLKQPELIKEFNVLQGRLDIAASNLAGLVSAGNIPTRTCPKFSPWRLISPPVVGGTPIEPSLKKACFRGSCYRSYPAS